MDLEDLISKFITGGGAGKVAAGSSSAEEKSSCKYWQQCTAVICWVRDYLKEWFQVNTLFKQTLTASILSTMIAGTTFAAPSNTTWLY